MSELALQRLLEGMSLTPEAMAFAREVLRTGIAPRGRKTGVRPSQPYAVEQEYARITKAVASATEDAIRDTILAYVREQVTADADMDPGAVSRILAKLRALTARIRRLDVREQVEGIAQRVTAWNAVDMSAVLGVPVDTLNPGVLEALGPWRDEQASLIVNVSEQMVERVAEAVGEAQATGMRVETLAGRIEAEFGVGQRRAQTIATDQVLTANARVTQERHQQAGITHYEWSTSGDDRVRLEHEAVDGEVFGWRGRGAPGVGVRGEPAHPGEAIRCRCVAIPHFD